MMEVVIVDDGNRLTVYELVERVIPCIIAKHYSENYIQGFRSTFRNLLAYCSKNEKKYFTAELAQQFMLDCYGVQPGTVERRYGFGRQFAVKSYPCTDQRGCCTHTDVCRHRR